MKIVISYAREDELTLEKLCERMLRYRDSIDIWWDKKTYGSQDWWPGILDKIAERDVLIFLLSRESIESDYCNRELNHALHHEKVIFPIKVRPFDDTLLPEQLKPKQYTDLTKGPDDLTQMTEVFRALDYLESVVNLSPQATTYAQTEIRYSEQFQPSGLDTDNANVLIEAGPGTGKTTRLLRQVTTLVEKGVDPERILVVTFTRRAAQELRDKLADSSSAITASTLHSYCFGILSTEKVFERTGRVVRPLLEFEERFLLEDLKLNPEFGSVHDRRKRLKAFEAAWSREQDQEPGWLNDPVDKSFDEALHSWLVFHRAVLISEIIPETLRFLRNNPASPERQNFDYVLVDEYQDLNRADQSLIKLLKDKGNVLVVGDVNQSIYGDLRYAHPEGIERFEELYKQEKTNRSYLSECYRCPSRVIEITNDLIAKNSQKSTIRLSSATNVPVGEIHVIQWATVHEEAEGIARFVVKSVDERGISPKDVLILTPRRQLGYIIRDSIRSKGVSAHSYFREEILDGNPKKLDDSKAQQAVTLLNLLFNPEDYVALRCWLGFGHQDLRTPEYSRLRNYCQSLTDGAESTFQVLDKLQQGHTVIDGYINGLVQRFEEFKRYQEEFKNLSIIDVINRIFPSSEEWAIPFREIMVEVDENTELATINENVRKHLIQPENLTEEDTIRIMSLHSSKGLEAKLVVVAGCVENLIPKMFDNKLSHLEQKRLLEEQRRLFYVALTRTTDILVVSSFLSIPTNLAHKLRILPTKNRKVTKTLASRFISELGPNCPKSISGYNWTY